MLTRNGQMVLMGDTMEVLYAIEELIKTGRLEEAMAYAKEARFALTQMSVNWIQGDAAYSVIAKSLKLQPETLKNDDSNTID